MHQSEKTETIFDRLDFACVPLVYMERVGFKISTAASHQRRLRKKERKRESQTALMAHQRSIFS